MEKIKEIRARVISQEKGLYRISDGDKEKSADGSGYLQAKKEKFKAIANINKVSKKH